MWRSFLAVVAVVVVGSFGVACGGEDEAAPGGSGGAGGGGSGGQGGAPTVVAVDFVEVSRAAVADDAGHLAFPDVARLADGSILLVYREGASHVDASGRLMKQFATPGGSGWTQPEVLYDEPNVDDRDPSVALLSGGDLLVSYFPYERVSLPDGTLSLHQVVVGRSTDGGHSFGPFEQVSSGPMAAPGAQIGSDQLWVDAQGDPIVVQACSSAAVELAGEVVIPAYGGYALNLSNLAGAPRSTISLLRSSDGHTYQEQPIAPDGGDGIWLQEPALLPLRDGSVLLQVRTAEGASPSNPGPLMQSRSDDDGASWLPWSSFPFIGHAPNLLQLDSGVVLSAFREINDAYNHEWVSFVYSLDGGNGWSDPIRVEDCGAVECGYPSMVELTDGRLLMVFYTAGGATITAVIFDVVTTTE